MQARAGTQNYHLHEKPANRRFKISPFIKRPNGLNADYNSRSAKLKQTLAKNHYQLSSKKLVRQIILNLIINAKTQLVRLGKSDFSKKSR